LPVDLSPKSNEETIFRLPFILINQTQEKEKTMKNKRSFCCFLTIVFLFCASTNLLAENKQNVESILLPENVILQWNRVLTQVIRTPGAHPSATIFPVRSYAMMHAAMFDAVNSVEGGYTPYLTDVPGSKNASVEAAAAKAAYDVLSALYPGQQALFNAELSLSLAGIEENRLRQGIRVGSICAAQVLARRANDGWNAPVPAYVLPPTPGNWQPTPPTFSIATFTHYPAVMPFALISGTQFTPPPPPALNSVQYAIDYNEVKALGSATSIVRTADQTLVARLWAGIGTPTNAFFAWNNVARDLSISHNLSTIQMARFFALFNMAAHDGLLSTFASKFQYRLWRPVTAIQRANEDGNLNTEPDPTWTTLIPTPPYPSYAGNMSGIGTSHATTFALFFGRDDIPFQHTWENGPSGTGGATRSYPSFTAMANESADSRIYGGIHFRFDNVAGQAVGRNVANFVFFNYLKPRQR
jgi:hypothetical protein